MTTAMDFVRERYPDARAVLLETSKGHQWYAISLDGAGGYTPFGGRLGIDAWDRTKKIIIYLETMDHLRMDRARRIMKAITAIEADS